MKLARGSPDLAAAAWWILAAVAAAGCDVNKIFWQIAKGSCPTPRWTIAGFLGRSRESRRSLVGAWTSEWGFLIKLVDLDVAPWEVHPCQNWYFSSLAENGIWPPLPPPPLSPFVLQNYLAKFGCREGKCGKIEFWVWEWVFGLLLIESAVQLRWGEGLPWQGQVKAPTCRTLAQLPIPAPHPPWELPQPAVPNTI